MAQLIICSGTKEGRYQVLLEFRAEVVLGERERRRVGGEERSSLVGRDYACHS